MKREERHVMKEGRVVEITFDAIPIVYIQIIAENINRVFDYEVERASGSEHEKYFIGKRAGVREFLQELGIEE